ncbi:RNA methyltransferase [Thioflexithrix psekupsensis]|uniref:tRNA (cytidine/uridine-2'-O-)-methyltransferase TrmJ n=1 Tax=Thioflexithrix psekupsensis TaxID=1570016 RepID=A0A251X5Z6_9GAMM|nr:RNA methyltransferase [Thioflexithrix psekupsensis]OUD13166.1 tRNA (cytosine(32)/uridine(32)-2'-O)-methyltransferase TrmJ [Thioflexithrix psekupsensis]
MFTLSLERLKQIKIILVGTTHSGNIGATARAMKNMGLSQLILVAPEAPFPSAEATARASGAVDVLQSVCCYPDLKSAIADSQIVFGTSARSRSLAWPMRTPRETAEEIFKHSFSVSLVFGREHSGLTNEELALCHYWVQIPTDEQYSSLNLAAAVQVLCYELRVQALTQISANNTLSLSDPLDAPATAEAMNLFYAHLEQTLIDIGFLDAQQPKQLMRRLQRLFHRAQPNINEVNILRGILTAIKNKK